MNKKKKTILILIWDMDIGGVQKRVRDIIFYLNKHYPFYTINLLVKRGYPTPILNQIEKLKKVNIHRFTQSIKRGPFPTIFWAMLWIAKKYIMIKPDIVLTFLNRLAIQMALLKKVIFWQKAKLVINESIYTSDYLNLNEKVLGSWAVMLFYPLADKIIVPTQAIKDDLSNNFKIPKGKIFIVPHWIVGKPKKVLKKSFDFIYIGRIEKEKNIFILLELIKYLKEQKYQSRLCILGKGSLESKLKNKIKEMKLEKSVFFYGFKEKVIKYLACSKILLLPSINEGMPNCVLEAYFNKIPVVVNNFPGAKEVVLDKITGLIAKNSKEFLKYAKSLLLNEKLRKKLGFNAFKTCFSNFGENNLKKFLEILLF